MPVIAIGAAVVADAFAVSAAVAGTLTTFGAIAAVGATVSAVGAVTKNKALEYGGMALGAVGGIGALAQSAGLFGAAGPLSPSEAGATGVPPSTNDITSAFADASGWPAGASGDVLDSLTNAGSGMEGGIWDTGAAADTTTPTAAAGMINNASLPPTATDVTPGSPAATAATQAQQPLVNNLGQVNPDAVKPDVSLYATTSQAEGNAQGVAAGINTPGQPNVVAPSGASSSLTGAVGGNNPLGTTNTSIGSGGSSTTPSISGAVGGNDSLGTVSTGMNVGADTSTSTGNNALDDIFGQQDGPIAKVLGFLQDNKLLAYGALQAGGSFISGLTNTVTPAQVSQLNAQAAANNAAAALTRQQTAAQAQPKSIASLSPVTGTPAPLLSPTLPAPVLGTPPGLINNVTGVPA